MADASTSSFEYGADTHAGFNLDEPVIDRFGLSIGRVASDRRAALHDYENDIPHAYHPSDGELASRVLNGAFAIMRLNSYQGRVFVPFDDAVKLSAALVGLAMSADAIAICDGVREGTNTVKDVRELMKSVHDNARALQREAREAEAKAQAQADADAYRRSRISPPSGAEPRRNVQPQ